MTLCENAWLNAALSVGWAGVWGRGRAHAGLQLHDGADELPSPAGTADRHDDVTGHAASDRQAALGSCTVAS